MTSKFGEKKKNLDNEWVSTSDKHHKAPTTMEPPGKFSNDGFDESANNFESKLILQCNDDLRHPTVQSNRSVSKAELVDEASAMKKLPSEPSFEDWSRKILDFYWKMDVLGYELLLEHTWRNIENLNVRSPYAYQRSIYVGNLNYETTIDELYDLFKDYGDITGIEIPQWDYGRSKGFAFIEFAEMKSVYEAYKLDGYMLRNRRIIVNEKKGTFSERTFLDQRCGSQRPFEGQFRR